MGLIALHLLPIALVRYFPSQDGPEHAYNAAIISGYHAPAAATWREFFVISHRPVPNWLTHLFLVALMQVVSPAMADKIVVAGYIVLFFLAARYAIDSVQPGQIGAGQKGSGWLLLLLTPLAYNVFLFFGFYNFVYSLAVLLLVIGYWLRHIGRFNVRSAIVLAVLGTLLYFCHVVAFGIAAILILIGAAQQLLTVQRTGLLLIGSLAVIAVSITRMLAGRTASLGVLAVVLFAAGVYAAINWRRVDWVAARRNLAPALMPVLAMTPATLLAMAFLTRQGGEQRSELASVRVLRLIDWAGVFSGKQRLLSAGLVAVLVVITGSTLRQKIRRQQWDRCDTLLATAGVIFGLTLIAPAAAAGGSFIVDRLALLTVLVWAVWGAAQLAAAEMSAALRRGMLGSAGAIAAAILLWDALGMHARAKQIDEFVAMVGHALPRGATVMAAQYDDGHADGTPRVRGWKSPVRFLIHAAGWAMADRYVAEVNNYEAGTGYFPLLFRSGYYFYIPDGDCVPPSQYLTATPGRGRVDYIVLWTGGAVPTKRREQAFSGELNSGYHEIARSSPTGWGRVYQRSAH